VNDDDFLDRAGVDRRLHDDVLEEIRTLFRFDDRSERNSFRVEAVDAGGENAIAGNKALPGVGDWYLSRTGYQAQQTREPEDPDRPDNLWGPVDTTVDFGAHGRFGSVARTRATVPLRRAATAAAASIAVALALRALTGRFTPYR